MSADSKIEWTDATWNPTTGCDKVSPGCDHCYAMTLAPRLKAMGSAHYQRDGDPKTSGPGFGVSMHPHALDKPLRWIRPRRIFVNSMSDLFHDEISDEFIAQVFAVMAIAHQHTFQVLTKRHGRMRSLLSGDFRDQVAEEMTSLIASGTKLNGAPIVLDRDGDPARGAVRAPGNIWGPEIWPLPNVWLGVSVENQQWANIRIPALLGTPAAVRFLSCEPLLGPVDLTKAIEPNFARGGWKNLSGLHWLIAGGESGRGARPMSPFWVRHLRDQCLDAGVAFHFKQWGEWTSPDGYTDETLLRVGKKAAGRQLDGRTWDEFPQAVGS